MSIFPGPGADARAPAARAGDRGNVVLAAAAGALCLLPLLLTPVLPFIDFYAHILRYYVLAHGDAGTPLASNYAPAWALLPNLGLDVLGLAILAIVPPLAAAKLIAALIMLTLYAGVLYLAQVLHGRLPILSIALAGILVHSHILIWGFSNFLLGLGLAIGGVGFWIANRDRPRRQLAVSAVIAVVLLFVHAFAFATWGTILGTVELMFAAEAGQLRFRPLAIRGGRLLLLAVVPTLIFLQMPTAQAEEGVTQVITNLESYAERGRLLERVGVEIRRRIDSFLRVAEAFSPPLDLALGLLLWGTIAAGLITGALRLDRRLWIAAPLMLVLVAIMPPSLFGVGHVDDRIPLVLLCLLAAGLSWQARTRLATPVLAILLGLFVLRMLLVSWGYHQAGGVYRTYLARIARIDTGEIGAPVLFAKELGRDRFVPRCDPLGPLLALKNGTAVPTFANPTQQPLVLAGNLQAAQERLRHAPPLPSDPVVPLQQQTLERYFAAGFDSIVTCDVTPPAPAPAGIELVAHEGQWTLYRRNDTP